MFTNKKTHTERLLRGTLPVDGFIQKLYKDLYNLGVKAVNTKIFNGLKVCDTAFFFVAIRNLKYGSQK